VAAGASVVLSAFPLADPSSQEGRRRLSIRGILALFPRKIVLSAPTDSAWIIDKSRQKQRFADYPLNVQGMNAG
jgi:hypothetical protein